MTDIQNIDRRPFQISTTKKIHKRHSSNGLGGESKSIVKYKIIGSGIKCN